MHSKELKALIQKFARVGPFKKDQLSFKKKIRVSEEIDLINNSKIMTDFFITKNGLSPEDFEITFDRAEPILFDEEYGWNEAIASGTIKSKEESFPVEVNLTEGAIWTVTLV